jgi:predicted transcriptional regulator
MCSKKWIPKIHNVLFFQREKIAKIKEETEKAKKETEEALRKLEEAKKERLKELLRYAKTI